MDGSGLNPIDPSWSPEPTRLQAALRGARETPLVPPFILFSTFVGFGALTNATGFSALDTFFMSAFVFALPGQVVLVDQMARGASVLTAAIAVAATGVRLLPMTVSILPMIRDRRAPKWMEFVLAYYCAVTVWVETMRRAPGVPKHLRAPYALGVAGLMLVASNAGALLGFGLASGVPPSIGAALLFMTPIYFLLSMLGSARSAQSLVPIALGLVLGPIFHLLTPDLDLILTGLVGGSISCALTRYGLKGSRKS